MSWFYNLHVNCCRIKHFDSVHMLKLSNCCTNSFAEWGTQWGLMINNNENVLQI